MSPAALPVEARGRGASRSRMADVARLAGVSTATVSRALRQPEIVSEELRRRIDDAVRRLAYRPNLMAGGLSTARSRTVGVIVPSIINSFFAATLEDMAEGLAAHGYQLMLGNSAYLVESEEALVKSFLAWSPAAIVLTGRHHSRGTLRALLDADVPVVEMWEMGERPLDGLVGFSHEAVGRAVADHLVARGATRFGFIGAALDRDRRAAERGRGFAEAIRSAGFAAPVEVSLADRASTLGGGEALRALMSQAPESDAVFCSNDVMALGALFACRRAGWSVPDRLRLCGFGDLDFAAASVPTLSTVRPPRREIGRCVADLLIRRFAGEGQTGEVIDLGFELVPRESS